MSYIISLTLFIISMFAKNTVISNNAFLIASGIFAIAGSLSYIGTCIKANNEQPKE